MVNGVIKYYPVRKYFSVTNVTKKLTRNRGSRKLSIQQLYGLIEDTEGMCNSGLHARNVNHLEQTSDLESL